MYSALWKALPGPIGVRVAIVLAVLAVALVVLAVWVFPWVDGLISPREATVVAVAAASSAAPLPR